MTLSKRTELQLILALAAYACASAVLADDAPIELFARQPAMVGAQLSPDGKRVAFLSSLKGRYHLVVEQFSPSFDRAILSAGEELEFVWVRWANNDRLVVAASFPARRFLAETTETRLLSVDAAATSLTPIVRPGKFKETGSRVAKDLPPPQIQDNVIHWLPEEPNHILVALDADLDGLDEVRRIDIRNGKFDTILEGFAGARTWIPDTSGRIRLGWGYDADRLDVLRLGDDDSWAEVKGEAWVRQGHIPLAFTADPNIVLVRGSSDAGLAVVSRLNLESGELLDTVFAHDSVDAGDAVLDAQSGAAVGVSFTEHLPATSYFDDTHRKLQATIDNALPDTSNSIASTSNGKQQVLIFASSDTHPGAYYLWDRAGKSLSLYSDLIPDLDKEILSPIEAVSYEARDGLSIPAYLTVPRGSSARNLPAVVLPHGGPQDRDDKSYWFLSQFLASRGYVVLQPNFRGSSGYGKLFANAGFDEWGGKMQDDVTDGAEWLIAEGIADPGRLCIVGWSYGGYAAAMGAVKTPELYQCAASINGVLNLPRLILDDQQYVGGTEWTRHMGLEGENAKTVSPYHQAESIEIPLLVVQAADDTRVHKDQGRRMADKLESLGKPVEYVEIESGGHALSYEAGRRQLLTSLDAFLAQHIGAPGNAR